MNIFISYHYPSFCSYFLGISLKNLTASIESIPIECFMFAFAFKFQKLFANISPLKTRILFYVTDTVSVSEAIKDYFDVFSPGFVSIISILVFSAFVFFGFYGRHAPHLWEPLVVCEC